MKRINIFALTIIILMVVLLGILIYSTLNPPNKTGVTGEVNISIGINPVKGSANSSVVMIEFSDFQCPACKSALPVINEILRRYDVAFYYRNFPLPMHLNSMTAALAASCANEQGKFWQYHDILFQNQESLDKENLKGYARQLELNIGQFNACLDSQKYRSEIEKDISDGKIAGVTGTPTFFINGVRVEGASFNEIAKVIDNEING